jgi:RES domain-containing protein
MAKPPPIIPPVPPPHPDSVALERAIGRCIPLVSWWEGTAYRVAATRRANAGDLLAGIGSRLTGGRWTPLGAFPATYLSCDYRTAVEEYLAGNRRRGLPPSAATPFVVTAVDARLTRILDVTDGRVRRRLRVSEHRMLQEPWWDIQARGKEAATQAIGRLVRAAGIKGLVVPSSALSGGANLVIFPDNLVIDEDVLDVVNADLLPPAPPT